MKLLEYDQSTGRTWKYVTSCTLCVYDHLYSFHTNNNDSKIRIEMDYGHKSDGLFNLYCDPVLSVVRDSDPGCRHRWIRCSSFGF